MTLWCGKMNHWFTPTEYADVHIIYGFCDGNSTVAVEQYPNSFLNCQILNMQVFSDTHHKLPDMGTIIPHNQENVAWQSIAVEECVQDLVQHSPLTTVQKISNKIGESTLQVWWTKHDEGHYPYSF
jgi:hypothetical protein